MKVTALIEDDLIKKIIELTGGKNITESIRIALNDYVSRKKLKFLSEKLHKNPLKFIEGFSAEEIRNLNRQV